MPGDVAFIVVFSIPMRKIIFSPLPADVPSMFSEEPHGQHSHNKTFYNIKPDFQRSARIETCHLDSFFQPAFFSSEESMACETW